MGMETNDIYTWVRIASKEALDYIITWYDKEFNWSERFYYMGMARDSYKGKGVGVKVINSEGRTGTIVELLYHDQEARVDMDLTNATLALPLSELTVI